MLATLACLMAALASQGDGTPAPPPGSNWILPPGNHLYDTSQGPVLVKRMIVEPGAYLRVVGRAPFVVLAEEEILIDGAIDMSGFAAAQVSTLYTPHLPEHGAKGAAGGGRGGTGSPNHDASSPAGGHGDRPWPAASKISRGGRGGETGYSSSLFKQERRGAGGGGGAFGPDVLGGASGLVAERGSDGHPLGIGAITGTSPPRAGASNVRPFVDANPLNDFWGRKFDRLSGAVLVGELAVPQAGVGAGAGGDSIQGASFPTVPFGPIYKDKKGAGGGGGGGLGGLIASRIKIGPAGSLRADGGDGATGENVLGFDHIAGSSGGGSGGMLVLEARLYIDLSQATPDALSAVGGVGGIGKVPEGWSKGGNGGPGLLQIHLAHEDRLLLPVGVYLADLSVPDAHVLLPEFF